MLYNTSVCIAHILRYLLISCASGMAGGAGVGLIISIHVLVRELYSYGSIHMFNLYMLMSAPFVFGFIGVVIATPAAVIFGGLMLILQKIFVVCRRPSVWIIVGCIVGAPFETLGRLAEEEPEMTRMWAQCAISGGFAAWTFLKLWNGTHIIPPLKTPLLS